MYNSMRCFFFVHSTNIICQKYSSFLPVIHFPGAGRPPPSGLLHSKTVQAAAVIWQLDTAGRTCTQRDRVKPWPSDLASKVPRVIGGRRRRRRRRTPRTKKKIINIISRFLSCSSL